MKQINNLDKRAIVRERYIKRVYIEKILWEILNPRLGMHYGGYNNYRSKKMCEINTSLIRFFTRGASDFI